jgi:hypothetical protein
LITSYLQGVANLNGVTSPAVVDLLGLLAYGELASFEQMATDAQKAPSLFEKAEMSKFASVEFEHYKSICTRLTGLGVDPLDAMQPFAAALDAYHAQLVPSNWHEGLVKSYIGEGIAADFYREVLNYLDPQTAELVEDVLADDGLADFAVERIRQACENDSIMAGRLALWGRRMMGEMIAQAGQVATKQVALAELFISTESTNSTAEDLTGLVNRLTVGHARRMDVLGFAS